MEQLMNSYMAIMAERNAAIRERNMAIVEKRKALADRDMAMLQRDEAVAVRNRAVMERDDAISQIQCMDCSTDMNTAAHIASEKGVSQGAKMHQRQHVHHSPHYTVHHSPHYTEPAYRPIKVPFSDVILDSDIASESVKSKKVKQKIEATSVSSTLSTKACSKIKRGTEVLSKQVTVAALSSFRNESDIVREGENLDKPVEWKDDLCLNQISFDEATIPVPVCSCTGVRQPCYRWGNGGWQSACCTTTLSMYPLPQLPNKRRSRIGGRKMSGGAFSKLLSRLAGEGHDISTPVDLKYHWAKHGTNRYSTIK